jgi:5-(aminomethyl)-3-furanmethanol phosphate kinase
MTIVRGPRSGVTVLKVGGGLLGVAGALDSVCAVIGHAAREQAIVVIPGGGPFADTVRELDRKVGLSPSAAHWMAHLAMDQYAEVLAERIPAGVVVEEPGAIQPAWNGGQVPVLAPSRWMRSADVLPHSWDVTSDSIAAFIAGALDATRLVLIKPGPNGTEAVDSYFSMALPLGLPYSIIGWDQLDQLFDGSAR